MSRLTISSRPKKVHKISFPFNENISNIVIRKLFHCVSPPIIKFPFRFDSKYCPKQFTSIKVDPRMLFYRRWSYGIVLWEVFTIGKYTLLIFYPRRSFIPRSFKWNTIAFLGDSPYPGVKPREVTTLLERISHATPKSYLRRTVSLFLMLRQAFLLILKCYFILLFFINIRHLQNKNNNKKWNKNDNNTKKSFNKQLTILQ